MNANAVSNITGSVQRLPLDANTSWSYLFKEFSLADSFPLTSEASTVELLIEPDKRASQGGGVGVSIRKGTSLGGGVGLSLRKETCLGGGRSRSTSKKGTRLGEGEGISLRKGTSLGGRVGVK